MDRITDQLLREFSESYAIRDLPESDQYEHFVNWCVVTREYQETFDLEDVHVGKDRNPGIDGIAIIVNGALVTESEEVDDLLKINKTLEVSMTFMQAKTSASFNGGDIGSFVEAVRDFFRDKPRLVRTETLNSRAELAAYIFSHSGKMRTNPTCSLFYVTAGTWTNDQNLRARLDQGKADLEQLQLFSNVAVTALGAADIQSWYRQGKETIDVEIDFPNKVTLPSLQRVNQAFIGVLPVGELFKLIVDEGDNLRRAVFEDNIRDFQGSTDVNNGIRATLASANNAEAFVVLNNGITIVCRDLKLTGNKCTVSGFQIVNGCQTSNVLYSVRAAIDPSTVLVPVKLVHTDDEEIVNAIIKSTNSQNAVKPEDLEAMTEFQKTLEQYYRTYSGVGQLYYERRSKQWTSSTVEKTRVVTIPVQIKAFAAMFLSVPHRVSGYYGTVRERNKEAIFRPDHKPIGYYTSALALYRLENLWRNKSLDTKWKSLKWYLLMLFATQEGGAVPNPSSKECEIYCKGLIAILNDSAKVAKAFEKVVNRIDRAKLPAINKDSLKSQSLREAMLKMP